jgi:hypothetical protein
MDPFSLHVGLPFTVGSYRIEFGFLLLFGQRTREMPRRTPEMRESTRHRLDTAQVLT